jgi:dipeptidyl-peptidase 4
MITINRLKGSMILLVFICLTTQVFAQKPSTRWAKDGNSFFRYEQNEIVQISLPSNEKKTFVSKQQLTPPGESAPLAINLFAFSDDNKKLLLYTNASRVWRINTRGNYWVLDLASNQLKRIGKDRPEASTMFAKFSPDGSHVAYVSDYNVFVENLADGTVKQLTTDGTRKFINGTFDWVYEEEFACRDGIRWSTDSKSVLYWQLDARDTRDYFMINNTDSVYSKVIPVEYPKVGEQPSACRLGVADIATGTTKWLNVPGEAREHYIVRAEYIPGTTDVLLQQLNRKQNQSIIFRANTQTGATTPIFTDTDEAWVDIYTPNSVENSYAVDFKHPVNWIANGKEFLWESEKDGWRHVYRISNDGKKQTLVTPGNFDVIAVKSVDEKGGFLYYLASPTNATQKYLYRIKLDGKGKPELLSPSTQQGTHNYIVSPNAKFASHSFSNSFTKPLQETIALPSHKPLNEKESIQSKLASAQESKSVEFFKVKTEEGVEMDGWMVKPKNFDATKKYPVLFFVYTEPWGQNVTDTYGVAENFLYAGDMQEDGYIYISLDNRGTPVPKGREWRKSFYRKSGLINTRDQALAAKEVLKWNFVDPQRIAVWGWSGGGTATLNLMFQFPEIYKTGISVAAVTNLLTYDNIYTERYMGLPKDNMQDFVNGSAITHAKNLQGKLLIVHGTGDDNVHFQNAEMLVNELVKHNKQFQYMAYPNRSHSMQEGEGTFAHLATLFTEFLKANCPPGGK